MVTGDASSNAGGATVYTGSTVVGNGSSAAQLTATQILQNTLTINAGSTVTIAPSGADMAAVAASDSSAPPRAQSPLQRFVRQQHGLQRSVPCHSSRDRVGLDQQHDGPAFGKPPRGDRAFGGHRSWLGREPLGEPRFGRVAVLVDLAVDRFLAAGDIGSGLLAIDSSAFGSGLNGATAAFAQGAGFGGSPAAVPEPSTLLLAAFGGIAWPLQSADEPAARAANRSRPT